jgi:hypothetical protein
MDRTSSYRPQGREHCFRLGEDEDQPCWGRVEMVDDGVRDLEDGLAPILVNPTYACKGHDSWPYVYAPPPREDIWVR